MSTKGRVTLPVELRRKLNWQPGARLTITETEDGVLLTVANADPDPSAAGAAAAGSPSGAAVGP